MERHTTTELEHAQTETRVIHIKPEAKKVNFTEETIDNEEMNKKKSNRNL